ncbi:nuclear transport factor 2 family protein [Polaribacter sp. Hel1_85]|uniref:nuclear transport factor 2 family protein n=1 Tax=Polaribacter sp. Hel1_85 TaxID=1250005 RepID=UPI00052E41BE|nr:nuclear transport factor 2 family protein [Polaribacter sp. Hel1_85]KGL62945.1 beta-lactamase [Polaribacter sp. Hel1_85]
MNSFLEPFRNSFVFKVIVFIAMLFYNFVLNAQVDKNSDLYKTLKSNDSVIFERTFNLCEVEKLDAIIADNFEFYHDLGGIQNREGFIKAIKDGLCSKPGNNKRQLVVGSLEVHQLKNNGVLYGAIQKGKHTFLQKQNSEFKTVGIADFTHLWILEKNQWKLKRVLSYNHKPYSE